MTAKVVTDNVSGETEIQIKSGGQTGTGLVDLDQDANAFQGAAQIDRQLDAAYKTLPVNKGNDPNINYLGSSYSGVDIKVIAHLYDTVNWRDKEIADTQAELDIANAIVDGATSLQGSFSGLADNAANDVLTFDERRSIFISSTGLGRFDETQQQALNVLLAGVFRSGNFSFLGIARMRRENDSILRSYRARAEELTNKIDHLNDIAEDSSATIALGTLQTISLQTFREKSQVRALGHSYPKGFTRGQRTLAGSMIFTIFNEHALLQLIRAMGRSQHYGERDAELSTLLPDQLPPIDLTIVFANEYGALSDLRIYGVEFISDSSVFSIEDLMSEQVMNFQCRDADVMTSRGKVRLSRLQTGMFNENDDKDLSGSSLLFDNTSYTEYLDKLKVRRRLKNR